MKIQISGINRDNHGLFHDILGIAGYRGAGRLVNDCTRSLDLGTVKEREFAGITGGEVERMVYTLIANGFSIRRIA